MSSAFNLSTLVAMQDQRVEQTSVYFWRCQLTSSNPRFVWNPEAPVEKPETAAATSKEAGDKKAADIGESTESDGENDDEDDAISTRHLLQVSGCVLGPKATGLHLVTVRTGTSYQKRPATGKQQTEPATPDAASAAEPDACPIVCMDPAAQRTLALSHEFVLEKQQPQMQLASHANPAAGTCVFELAEGGGPVWLTGTHRIHRVVPVSGAAEDSEDDGDDGEEEDEEVDEEADEEEEEASNDDEEEEEIEEEADDDQEMIEEVKPLPTGKKTKQQKAAGAATATNKASQAKKKPQSTAAAANGKQARKRVRPDS